MQRRWLWLVLLPLTVQADDGLTIAVASNFLQPAAKIADAFTAETGIPVRLSSGSTGKLYAQIVNAAPYDIFLAADVERPRLLQQDGHALPESLLVYASGFVVLWSASPALADKDCLLEFERGQFRRLAIANPRTAPYGAAAESYLRNHRHWESMADKIVYGENVNQAFQFVATGNATFGIVAASLLRQNHGVSIACRHQLGDERSTDLVVRQAGVILRRTENAAAARRFMTYLKNPAVQTLLKASGYATPAVPESSN